MKSFDKNKFCGHQNCEVSHDVKRNPQFIYRESIDLGTINVSLQFCSINKFQIIQFLYNYLIISNYYVF